MWPDHPAASSWLTAIRGRLQVPHGLFHLTPCPVRYKRHLELLLFKIAIYTMVLLKLPPGGQVAKEPMGKSVTGNYGKEKNNMAFPRNTENLLWVFWKGLYWGYSFFWYLPVFAAFYWTQLLQRWAPALLIPVKQWLVWHPGRHKPCRSSEWKWSNAQKPSTPIITVMKGSPVTGYRESLVS